jgi:hypothetical protein
MSNLRFVMVAIALFAGAFVGVSWAARSFPGMAMRAAPLKPDVSAPAHDDRAAQPGVPLDAKPKQPSGRERDQLALTAIQAAEAYARAPCDTAAKAAFIVAASTYLRTKATGGSAPPDARVHQAIKAAVEAGGIRSDEFPSGTDIVGAASQARPSLRCINSAGLRP